MVERIACLLIVFAAPTVACAQPRGAVAKSTSPAASFAAKPAGGQSFAVLGAGAELYAGDLLVALPGAALESKDRSVALKSFADFEGRSPLPILETAVILGEAEKDVDFAFTLDRGRVDVTNTKASGAVTVRVHFWDQTWTIKLEEPGSRVAVELCGRWPAGTRFKVRNPEQKDPPSAPMASLVLLVLNGSARVTSGDTTLGLTAPPGAAMLEWDSVAGAVAQPKKLNSLPDWADPNANLTERGKRVAAAVEKFRAARAEKPDSALRRFAQSANSDEQRVALVTLGSLDDLLTLGQTLVAAKTLEEWDFGITVLRHWLGRSPGQDQKLYQTLIASRGYTEPQAQTVMQLLFGFTEKERQTPETYEVLIDYLTHEKAGIRNLAAWHLIRLAPQGKEIPYRPDGTATEAAKTQLEWKKIIPAGELPPPAKK